MSTINYYVDESHSGKTLKIILRNELKISAGLLSKIKSSGKIQINGMPSIVSDKANFGDIITVRLPIEKSETIIPVNIPLNIVYEDEYLIIVNKPKDMPTHPSTGNRNNTLANACMYFFKDRDFVFRPINRLDRDTTGLVVIAKDARTSALMSDAMKTGDFKKTYYAITNGIPKELCGHIRKPIGRCSDSIIKRAVSPCGQFAHTEYRVINVKDNKALVEIVLHTGRTHQIRVHFAYIGTPLLYDYLYGTEVRGETLYLHCGKINFTHPFYNKEINISTPYNFPIFD